METQAQIAKSESKANSTNEGGSNGVGLVDNRTAPLQLAKGKSLSLADERKKREGSYLTKPWRRYDDMLKKVRHSVFMTEVDIEQIENRLEDDDDVRLLNTYKRELHKLDREARRLRRAIPNRAMGVRRSQDVEHKETIGQLEYMNVRVHRLRKLIKEEFPTHSGGFGAKGRAHKMDPEVNVPFPAFGSVKDNSFVGSFSVNGDKLADNIYKKPAKVASEQAKGVLVDGKGPTGYPSRKQALAYIKSKLGAVDSPQDVNFTNTPVARPRGDGQYANMAKTNATGYAWAANVPGWQSQRWEWLHIRGAGLGGHTDSSNLVVGTRDSNTHMIPFESNIRLLATAVNGNPNYSALKVRWWVSSMFGGAPHAYNKISIAWQMVKANAHAKEMQGIAEFSPLHTGSNISKKEVELIENALSTARENISK